MTATSSLAVLALLLVPPLSAILAYFLSTGLAGLTGRLGPHTVKFASALNWLVIPAAVWLRLQGGEAVLVMWSPVSLVGTPLTLSFMPAQVWALLGVLIARGVAESLDTRPDRFVHWPEALLRTMPHAGLVLTALAGNWLTLILGASLYEIAAIVGLIIRRPEGLRTGSMGQLVLRQIALAVLIATAFLSVSDGDSLIFALGALSHQRVNLIALWVSLRLLALVLPLLEGKLDSKLIATDEGLTMLACIHPLIATSLQLSSPILALSLALTAFGLIRTLLLNPTTSTPVVRACMSAVHIVAVCSLASQRPEWIGAACVGAACGGALLNTLASGRGSRTMRLVCLAAAAAAFAGVPGLTGFSGISTITRTLYVLPSLGWITAILFLGVQMLLVASLAHIARLVRADPVDVIPASLSNRVWAGLAIAMLLVSGLFPTILGNMTWPALIRSLGTSGWFGLFASIAAGVLLLRGHPYLRERLAGFLEAATQAGFPDIEGVMGAAFVRIARPIENVLPFFESDGALIWAVILSLLAVLVSRPGGP